MSKKINFNRDILQNEEKRMESRSTLHLPNYTLQDVSIHDSIDDSWTIIHRRVYNITEFMKTHPGGRILRLAAGRDGTDLYQSYHPPGSSLAVRRALYTLPVVGSYGEILSPAPSPASSTQRNHIQSYSNSAFYFAVRKRVDDYLRETEYNSSVYSLLYFAEVYFTFLAYLGLSFYIAASGSLPASIAVGFLMGRLGFIMHSGNHNSGSGSTFLNRAYGKIMNIIGGSQVIWLYEHQVAHHLNPNEIGKDNDCEIGYPWIRLHPMLPKVASFVQRNQHLMTFVGMTFGLLKWYLSDFTNFNTKQVGNVKITHVNTLDEVEFYTGKICWGLLHVVLPLCCLSPLRVMLTLFAKIAVGSHYLENIFIVNHIQTELMSTQGEDHDHWAVKQVRRTSNWSSGSSWWTWFSGGLNHQIEHHLFPSMHPYAYPKIASIVKETCEDFGLPYMEFSHFGSAWLSMARHLFRMRK